MLPKSYYISWFLKSKKSAFENTFVWCTERTDMLWIYCGKIFLQQDYYYLDINVIFLEHFLETDAKNVRQSLSIASGMMCYYLKIDHCCCKAFVIPLLCCGWNLLSLCIKASFFTLLLSSFPPSHFLFFSYTTLVYRMVYAVCGVYTERKREIAAVNYRHILLLLR